MSLPSQVLEAFTPTSPTVVDVFVPQSLARHGIAGASVAPAAASTL